MSLRMLLTATTALVFTMGAAMAAEPLTRAEVEEIAKKVILDNPELLMRSVQEYQIKMQADQLAKSAGSIVALKKDLQENPASPFAGNAKGDITIVEFFDYHCGYCKHMLPVVSKILEEDKNVRFVFKEFPILSDDSTMAAKAALAVWKIDQAKYFAFHSALMKASGAYNMQQLQDTAKAVGIDPEQLKKTMEDPDITKELEKNRDMATAVGISGTPAIIIGTELMPGALDYDALKAKIEAARKGKK